MGRLEHVSLFVSSPAGAVIASAPPSASDGPSRGSRADEERSMAIVEAIESSGGARRLRVSSPVTREKIGEVTVASPAEVRAKVARARAAQPAWAAAGFDER